MPNRVEIDIQGTIYTVPINPIAYDHEDSSEHTLHDSLDGTPVRFVPYFDSRRRVMHWENLPNTEQNLEMIATLKSAVGLSGVKINHRDLDARGDNDVWRDIRIDAANHRLLTGAGGVDAISNLKYNFDLVFSYVPPVSAADGDTQYAFFQYGLNMWQNENWIYWISGVYRNKMHTFVMHPNAYASDHVYLKAIFPNSYRLAYFDCQTWHMGTYTGGYWSAMNSANYAVSGYFAHFIAGGSTPAGIVGDQFALTSYPGYFSIPNKTLADSIITVIANNVAGVYNGHEFDGVYIDNFTPEIADHWPGAPANIYDRFINSGWLIDIDNDGSSDDLASLQTKYKQAKNYFASGLRDAIGPSKIIMGNCAGDSFHPELNSMAIENIDDQAHDPTFTEALQIFQNHKNNANRTPTFYVDWVHSATASGADTVSFCNAHSDVLYGMASWWLLAASIP